MNQFTWSLVVGFSLGLGWSSASVARFDCYPEPSGDESTCLERGCIWNSSTTTNSAPSCYYPSTWGYSVQGSVDLNNGTETIYQLSRINNFVFPYSGGVDNVLVSVTHVSPACIRLRYLDAENPLGRYQVPMGLASEQEEEDTSKDVYTFSATTTSSGLFGFDIARKSGNDEENGEVVVSSNNLPGLTYSDQFLQVMLSFPDHTQLYGWGERYSQVKIPTDQYTTLVSWSRDILDSPGYGNSYGVHPFLLGIEPNGNVFGVLILNSNAMELVVTPLPAIQYRTIGGILDIFVFFGPSAREVIQQYWDIIGYPMLPPFWSLGFHLSRWGYNTLNETRKTMEGMVAADVPYDTQWNDIDYMDGKKDFTYDGVNFAGLPEFVNELHESYGMHYVMIVDPAISNASDYTPYSQGLKNNVFITNDQNQVLIGEVWPGPTVFPDFFRNSTQQWWTDQISSWHQVVPFDGLWIDMNEPSNFVAGQLGGCNTNPYDDPPYFPTSLLSNSGSTGLATQTLCMSAQQTLVSGLVQKHYNVHSLYGHSEAVSTYQALNQLQQSVDKRAFILSRSTYAGSGQFAAHWTGDNSATFTDMQISISGIIAFNMFGIPFVGADICGYNGNTTVELCTRWMELGSFYPFSRNHNGYGFIAQDPVSLGEPVTTVSRKYLTLRYQLLPYLYTLFYRSHVFGEVVVQSIWLVDDWRNVCLEDNQCMSIETQFLWGNGLLISPALASNQTEVNAFFPALNNENKEERWFELLSGTELPIFGDVHNQWQVLDCPLDNIPLHIRGGFILPFQKNEGTRFGVGQTTTESRQNPFQLVVALDSHLNASGEIFVDDGESQDSLRTGKYLHTLFNVSCEMSEYCEQEYLCLLQSSVVHRGFDDIPDASIVSVLIYGFYNKYFMPGVDWTTANVTLQLVGDNDTVVDYSFDTNTGSLSLSFFNNATPMAITENIYTAWILCVSSTAATTSTSSGTGGDGNDSNSNTDTTTIIGIVVGVVLGLALIIGIACFMWFKRKPQVPSSSDYVSVEEMHPL